MIEPDPFDAYGNRLPKATRRQLNKEQALWNAMRRQMESFTSESP